MRALFENKPLDFAPGTGWNYSNSGYSMLGYIVQKATRGSYWDAMKKYVFQPAGMQHSGFDFAHLENKDKATGYFSDNEEAYTKETPVVDSSVSFAAGAIYSTVGDLFRFHEALQQEKIISKASQETAYTPFKNRYGFGWMIDSLGGHRTVSHSGGIYGFRSNFLRVTSDDICIVLLSNTETPALEKISKKLLAAVYHLPYKIPVKRVAVKLKEDLLRKYAGTYKIDNPALVLEIKLENGELVVYPVNGPRSVLCPSDTSHFFIKGDEDFDTRFITDSTGKVTGFEIDHGGNLRTAKKLQ
jgi:CubicO group peptidase (beta-lactamase class C family)